MPRFIDITGLRFGKLLVINRSKKTNRFKERLWLCICDCGNRKYCTTGALRHGGNTSCGCLLGNPTHGDWNLRIRRIWVGMMARCYKENHTGYNIYGAKGIRVCDEWHDYQTFKRWAFSNNYSDSLTLDRWPNQKGNYEPTNCRWATYKQQSNNRSSNRIVIINGISKTIAEWSDMYGIDQIRIRKRLELGWEPQMAVSKPIDKNKISNRYR